MPAAGSASATVAALRPVCEIMRLLLAATDECRLLDALLPALREAVPSDGVAWTTVSAAGAVVHATPALLPEVRLAAFEVHARHDPLVVQCRNGGHPGPVDAAAGHLVAPASGGVAVYRPVGANRQLALDFPAGPGCTVHLAFSRRVRAFTVAERDLLGQLRPLLATAMSRIPPRPPAPLTHREGEVLDLLRLGLADQEIARRLGISPRTVGKHLEHVYGKLGARGRLRALASWRGEPGAAVTPAERLPRAGRAGRSGGAPALGVVPWWGVDQPG